MTGVAAASEAALEGYRTALLVPFAAALVAAAVSLPGVRGARARRNVTQKLIEHVQ
ncbi:hypothetical protein Slala05_58370 [Streptomyces lavendulae subsp. lavendulae]|nr:hypothetical protein Slala05_58370 [Streptomyces lavendulae subsp. lavendulae]